jgi:hypothetical protein
MSGGFPRVEISLLCVATANSAVLDKAFKNAILRLSSIKYVCERVPILCKFKCRFNKSC